MHVILRDNRRYILRFDRGEEVMESLRKFCEDERIDAGFFSAIGAAEEVTISSYNPETKGYDDSVMAERLEIAGLNGNVSTFKGKTTIHAHGSFSDPDFKTYSGHVKRIVISATCEIALIRLEGKLERQHDEGTGLNLLRE